MSDTKSEKKTRSFKIMLNGELKKSVFKGDSPYQAANKALSESIRTIMKNGGKVDDKIYFTLIETTKGSSRKEHEYEGYRVKLDNPVSYEVSSGQTITKEYKNILRKIKKMNGGKTTETNQNE